MTTPTEPTTPAASTLPWADDKRLNGSAPHCDRCDKLCTPEDCIYVGGHCDGYYHQACWDAQTGPPGELRVIEKYGADAPPRRPSYLSRESRKAERADANRRRCEIAGLPRRVAYWQRRVDRWHHRVVAGVARRTRGVYASTRPRSLGDFMEALMSGWRRERTVTQMTLGGLIDRLESMPPEAEMNALGDAHSYRGYYDDLAFEYARVRVPVATALAMCREALGREFHGYKGGDYLMGRDTPVWIANEGLCGKKLMAVGDDGALELAEDERA